MIKTILLGGLLGLSLFAEGIGYNYMSSNKSELEQIRTQIDSINEAIALTQEQLNSYGSITNSYVSNTEMIETFLTKCDCQFVSATAQSVDSSGQMLNVLTVNSLNDVAYFTSTVTSISLKLEYKDLIKTLQNVLESDITFNEIEFDESKNVMTINVAAVTQEGSVISNEITDPIISDDGDGEIIYTTESIE